MANPNLLQGNLTRLRASVALDLFPQLNVIAGNLGPEGLNITWGREATTRIDTLTGQVTSAEPYIPARLTMNLLRTQALGLAYELQRLTNTILGDGTVRTDAPPPGISLFRFTNLSIGRVGDMRLNGKDALYAVELDGVYAINSALWN